MKQAVFLTAFLALLVLVVPACGDDDDASNTTLGNLLNGLDLGAITITPEFNRNVTNYTATVPYSIASGTLTLSLGQGVAAAVTLGGTPVTAGSGSYSITLATGENILLVTVSKGADSRVYRVLITRAATPGTVATLANIILNDSEAIWDPEFSPATTVYTVQVEESPITVTPVASDSAATLRIGIGNSTNAINSGSPSAPILLDFDNGFIKTVYLLVTAEDTVTQLTYTLTLEAPH